jgi:hypothetical protein
MSAGKTLLEGKARGSTVSREFIDSGIRHKRADEFISPPVTLTARPATGSSMSSASVDGKSPGRKDPTGCDRLWQPHMTPLRVPAQRSSLR